MTQPARLLITLGCAALSLMALPSCSSTVTGPGGAVKKVKVYNLRLMERVQGSDVAVHFERSYHLYGAVTRAEQVEREGDYYTFFWRVADRSQPVTVKLEYRQQNTGLAVKVKEVQVSDIRRNNVTKVSVIGPEFQTDGAVTAWRVSLMRGKEELVHSDSFLWK